MASEIQIVPKWQFPHVETFIYDNTEVTDTSTVETDDSFKTIHVFRSGKGIDNKIVKKTDLSDFTDTFGKTDYKKYGQPLMMPVASLNTGLTSVYAMRVMPEDSTYANAVLYAYYRTVDTTITEAVVDPITGEQAYGGDDGVTPQTKTVTKKMFQVMFRSVNYGPTVEDGVVTAGIFTAKDLDAAVKADTVNNKNIEDPDGVSPEWVCVPLLKFRSVGHGIYGNDYRWRITKNTEYEKDYEKKIYTFEILNDDNGVEKVATYVGTIITSSINSSSVLIDDVISNYDDGTYPVDISVYEDSVDAFYTAYSNFLTELATDTGVELTVPDEDEFDIFFGKDLNAETSYSNYLIVDSTSDLYPLQSDENAVSLSDVMGSYLGGGHDGSFAFTLNEDNTVTNGALTLLNSSDYTKKYYVDAVRSGINYLGIEDATVEDYIYAKAFNGLLDKAILSTRRTPADYLLDANYSYYTKISLAQFAITRNDAVCYIDTGMDYDTFSSSNLRTLEDKFSGIFMNRAISINAHSYKVADPFSNRKVEVTSTYFIASALPTHWNENGMQQPFAKSFAVLTGHVKNSVSPVVDLYESDLMNELANHRINYIEAVGENVFQRGIQNTAQTINSDLLEESNMHILFWLKRNIEADNYSYLYNFASASERTAFRQYEVAKYENIVGTLVSSFDITFDMNDWETDRQILHCYVEVVFRTIMKRGIIEIDVNRRSAE